MRKAKKRYTPNCKSSHTREWVFAIRRILILFCTLGDMSLKFIWHHAFFLILKGEKILRELKNWPYNCCDTVINTGHFVLLCNSWFYKQVWASYKSVPHSCCWKCLQPSINYWLIDSPENCKEEIQLSKGVVLHEVDHCRFSYKRREKLESS